MPPCLSMHLVNFAAELDGLVEGLDDLEGDEAVAHAIGIAARFMTGLDGVYALLDCDNTLFLGRCDHAVAYVETDRDDPSSPIVERGRWHRPAGIEGRFVGINITFDGRLVMTTDHGCVICLARDFSDYDAIQLPGAETDASGHCAQRAAEYGHTGYGWVRTSSCTGDDGGIYVSSVDTIHKVVWTGERLSLDPADGAWSARYRNGGGDGSGTTPSLVGFGDDEDRFVVIALRPAPVRVGPSHPEAAGGLGQHRGLLAQLRAVRGRGARPGVHLRHAGRPVDDRGA